MIVRGQRVPCPVPVRTFLDGETKFRVRGRRDTAVGLVLHEVAGRTVEGTVRQLLTHKDGLGIHLIVAPDGTVTQHADLATDIVFHAGAHNSHSVGIEVVAPYYPSVVRAGDPWKRTIQASWAHKGAYVLPTPESAETVAQLVDWMTSSPAAGLTIPFHWPGVVRDVVQMRGVEACRKPVQGVYAHHHIGNHADAAWLCLYAYLRLVAGLSPERAYEEAAERAEGRRWTADVSDLVLASRQPPELPPMPWTEEEEKQLEDLCPGTWASLTSEPVCY